MFQGFRDFGKRESFSLSFSEVRGLAALVLGTCLLELPQALAGLGDNDGAQISEYHRSMFEPSLLNAFGRGRCAGGRFAVDGNHSFPWCGA